MSITREEAYLNAIAEGGSTDITPVTREEMFLARIAGQNVTLPAPTTRIEALLNKIAMNGAGGGGGASSGVKVTEYVVTENADRALWFNEQKIKLVKGLNVLTTSKFDYASSVTYVGGAVTFILMLWDGVSVTNANNAVAANCHLRGMGAAQSAYNYFGGFSHIIAGNTTKYAIAEDGTLTFTTSATGVTTDNYNNSFIEGGYTYRLLQVESEVVC